MSKQLIERIDAALFYEDSGYSQLLGDCRDELTKQAERVKALEEMSARWKRRAESKCDAREASTALSWCADELAAVLKEGE